MTSFKIDNVDVILPRIESNIFFILFEVATGKEFNNSNYLFLKELPLGYHSVKMNGKHQPITNNQHQR